jgi:hypothetical protein
METFVSERPRFSTPDEEIAFLRQQVALREQQLKEQATGRQERSAPPARPRIEADRMPEFDAQFRPSIEHVRSVVRSYTEVPAGEVLAPGARLHERELEAIVLELKPEQHDATMAELLAILHTKGVRNALSVVEKLADPHIEDDFERFLVQFVKAGYPLGDVKNSSELYRALKTTLFEVLLPADDADAQHNKNKEQTIKELVAVMEQFYAGMLSIERDTEGNDYCAFELGVANNVRDVVAYVAIHDSKRELFEKHILAVFPRARLAELKDDYNIFTERGYTAGSYAFSLRRPIFTLKTYEDFHDDPLNILLGSFGKIDAQGEGATLQIIFKPAGDGYVKNWRKAIDNLQKGMPTKEATDIPETVGDHVSYIGKELLKNMKDAAFDVLSSKPADATKEKKDERPKPVDTIAIENITKKIATPIVEVNIRILASATDKNAAIEILSNIESAFNQYDNPLGNALSFKRVPERDMMEFVYQYAFRLYSERQRIPLSLREIASILHFPGNSVRSTPELKAIRAASAPAPLDVPQQGTLLGVNAYQNSQTRAYMSADDRLRHLYVIGQTGTGKTTLLKNMIVQDIQAGHGVCMIDPHGSDIADVLSAVPPERYEDIIYFDPAYAARPMALNMLEFDARYPEQKTFVVNEMLSIFNKLFDMKVAGGPMFEQYFRNAVLLVLEHPESGNTLLDVARVLSNKAFRELKLGHCHNPLVVQFWRDIAEKAGGEASLQNIVPYITSKFDVFLANDIMRPVVSQEHSTFNFREIMDGRKILLVNLSKGRLGDINAHLIGLIVVGKILMAALSRADSLDAGLPPFYLYIDEFQNITTDSIAQILSEARKYKLSLTVAHQFIGQLDESIRDAVFGNVGSMAAFRIGADDAEFLEKQFAPVFSAKDLMNIENRHAYVKLLAQGKPLQPFDIATMAPAAAKPDIVAKLKELSYLKYGRPKADVDADIQAKYAAAAVRSSTKTG